MTGCTHTGETEEEDTAHPIQRARQALRNAELHAESAEDGDIETGAGEAVPTASCMSSNLQVCPANVAQGCLTAL